MENLAGERPPITNYEIVERIGVIRENPKRGTKLELNLIKWDGRMPVYDLRLWVKDESGKYMPAKGVKLYYEDILILNKILSDL